MRDHLAAELARERRALAEALDRHATANDSQVALEATLRAVTGEREPAAIGSTDTGGAAPLNV